jgi:hypothetical protein
LARLSYVNDVTSVSLSFNSPDSSCSLSSTYVLFEIFINVSGLEGRKAHDYLRMFYIIYNNYCKQILIYIFLFIPVFDSFRSSCWLSSMLDQESKTPVILNNMSHCAAFFMSSVFLTFIRHMSLGKCFYFGILCFILNRKKLKLSDETLIEICVDKFSWSLRKLYSPTRCSEMGQLTLWAKKCKLLLQASLAGKW